MIDHVLKNLSSKLLCENQDTRKLSNYIEMRQHPGWAVHQELLLLIRGSIAEYLLSSEFTNMLMDEKDIIQRSYSEIDKMIRFLLNPMSRIQNIARIGQHNEGIMNTIKTRLNKMRQTQGEQP